MRRTFGVALLGALGAILPNWSASAQPPKEPLLKSVTAPSGQVRVRVPLSYVPTDATHLGFVRIAEAPGQPVTSHALCVSANACDFSGCANAGDTAPGVSFTVSGPPAAGVKNVVPGQVFWINVAHLTDNGDPSCPTETCGILLDFASPNRY